MMLSSGYKCLQSVSSVHRWPMYKQKKTGEKGETLLTMEIRNMNKTKATRTLCVVNV